MSIPKLRRNHVLQTSGNTKPKVPLDQSIAIPSSDPNERTVACQVSVENSVDQPTATRAYRLPGTRALPNFWAPPPPPPPRRGRWGWTARSIHQNPQSGRHEPLLSYMGRITNQSFNTSSSG